MFATLRNGLLGLFIASAIAMALCAVFLAASLIGVLLPRSAWAEGWLPVQVETEAPGAFRRKITRFSSLERAVAKAAPGDTVKVLASINVAESISVDKDLAIVIGEGCTMHVAVGQRRPVFSVEPGCRVFSITAKNASRIAFAASDSGGLVDVAPGPNAANINVRGINVHDAALADGCALFDLSRSAKLSLESVDIFNINAPAIQVRPGSCANVVITDSRLERVKGNVAIDLSADASPTLFVCDSVLIGSYGCNLICMARPNLLLCDNSYLSALGANPIVVDDAAAGATSELLISLHPALSARPIAS